jgi:hypothetical protein
MKRSFIQISLFETITFDFSRPFSMPMPRIYLCLRANPLGSKVFSHYFSNRTKSWENDTSDVPIEKVELIDQLLEKLGIPGRELNVSPAFDTSDIWYTYSLCVWGDAKEYAQDFSCAVSGFEGKDAKPFEKLLGILRGLKKNIYI